MSTNRNKTTEVMSFRIDKKLKEILVRYCDNNNIQKQELFRILLLNHLFSSTKLSQEDVNTLKDIGIVGDNLKYSPVETSLDNPELTVSITTHNKKLAEEMAQEIKEITQAFESGDYSVIKDEKTREIAQARKLRLRNFKQDW
jgi:hypothetical protein